MLFATPWVSQFSQQRSRVGRIHGNDFRVGIISVFELVMSPSPARATLFGVSHQSASSPKSRQYMGKD